MNIACFCSFSYLDIILIVLVGGYIFLRKRRDSNLMKLNGDYTNKRVFITGGGSEPGEKNSQQRGIGAELAIQFSNLGAEVIITGRSEEKLKLTAKMCKDPNKVKCYVLDMENPENVQKWCEEKGKEIGTLDVLIHFFANVLIHNAGLSMRDQLHNTQIGLGQKLLDVDFLSIFAMTKGLLPIMNNTNGGSVVCGIGSLSGINGAGLRTIYSGVKGAMDGFFKSLGCEINKPKEGMNVHSMIIHPGYVQTNVSINALVGDGTGKFGKTDKNIKNGMSVELCCSKIIDSITLRKTEVWISHSPALTALLYVGKLFPTLVDIGLYRNMKNQVSAKNEAE